MLRSQFVFSETYWEAIKDLPTKDRHNILDAILGYAFEGTEPNLTGVSKSIFLLIRPSLDASLKK